MGRKKKPETLEKERKKLEKEIEISEQIIKDKKESEKLNKKIKKIQDTIREDLLNQLQDQEKFGKHFEDLVEDYVYNVGLKIKLQNDIDTKGIRYKVPTGNGHSAIKPNESIINLHKTNAQMLKILSDLDLKEPEKYDSLSHSGDNPENENSGDDIGDDLL